MRCSRSACGVHGRICREGKDPPQWKGHHLATKQSMLIDERERIWNEALAIFLASPSDGTLFELDASGEVARLPE